MAILNYIHPNFPEAFLKFRQQIIQKNIKEEEKEQIGTFSYISAAVLSIIAYFSLYIPWVGIILAPIAAAAAGVFIINSIQRLIRPPQKQGLGLMDIHEFNQYVFRYNIRFNTSYFKAELKSTLEGRVPSNYKSYFNFHSLVDGHKCYVFTVAQASEASLLAFIEGERLELDLQQQVLSTALSQAKAEWSADLELEKITGGVRILAQFSKEDLQLLQQKKPYDHEVLLAFYAKLLKVYQLMQLVVNTNLEKQA